MDRNKHIGLLIMRLLLGFIFLMQGYGKVFSWGVENVFKRVFSSEKLSIFPEFFLYGTAYYTSYVELLGGLLLVIGFKRDWALYALGSVLVIVTFGHGLQSPIWDLSNVMYRAILLIGILLLPKEWDKYSVDNYLKSK